MSTVRLEAIFGHRGASRTRAWGVWARVTSEDLRPGFAPDEIAALSSIDALSRRCILVLSSAFCRRAVVRDGGRWGTRQSLVLPDEIPALAEITSRPKLPSTSPAHLNLIFNFLP